MSASRSVTYWVQRLKTGEREAVQQLWEGYFARLVRLARATLGTAPRRGLVVADEEDLALSAFDSFCRAAAQGRFPKLEDRNDLWHLLVLIATRKAVNLIKHERRQKRGGGKVVQSLDAPSDQDSEEGALFGELIAREPDPALAAQVTEECQRLLERLGNEELRQVALAKLEGCTNEEIATALGRAVGTVERKLRLIRSIWDREAARE